MARVVGDAARRPQQTFLYMRGQDCESFSRTYPPYGVFSGLGGCPNNLILSLPSPEEVPTLIYEGIIRANYNVVHRSNDVFFRLYSPKRVEGGFSEVHIQKAA
jgi:hypothetical protein